MNALLALVLATEVNVFAAASLTDALTELAADYERRTGVKIVLNLGASSTLARQIEQGAPADLFLSADEATMQRLITAQRIDGKTRRSVLSNTLVIVVPEGAPRIDHPRRLSEARFATIALAEPSSVPAGVYARQYFEQLGIWTKIAPKVVPTDNVRSALAAVEAGNADAAVVYRTDTRIAKRVRIAYEVPRAAGPKISYPFAAVANAPPPALRFLSYLRSPFARRIFARHGFLV